VFRQVGLGEDVLFVFVSNHTKTILPQI
jgi:hypothetical protein